MTWRGVSLLSLALAACCAGAAFAQSPGAAPAESSNELAATAAAPVAASLGRADLEPEPRRAVTAPSAARPRSNEANPLWAIPIETLRATKERPLFSASRRPPPPPVAAAEPVISAPPPPAPEQPEQPQMTLVGVVHGPSTDIGLFSNESGKLVRLRVGEADHGWIVRSVDVRATTLEKESRQVTLALPPRNAEILAAANQPPPMAEMAFANPVPIPGQKFPSGVSPRRGRHHAP
jgi:general secretion pathway protein N